MLNRFRQRLDQFQPQQLAVKAPEASVLIALTNEPEPKVILTQRARRLSTHAGEVAFPGGKQDATDPDSLFTALREAEEEIGLDPRQVDIISPLNQVMSLHQLKVTPWVGVVPPGLPLVPNPGELDSIFTVPVSFLLEQDNYRLDTLDIGGKQRRVPSYQYSDYTIWGLTAYILVELLNVGFAANLPLKPRAENLLALAR